MKIGPVESENGHSSISSVGMRAGKTLTPQRRKAEEELMMLEGTWSSNSGKVIKDLGTELERKG